MGHGIDLRTVIIEDRSHIILWEDKSMGGLTLRDECSYLFNVTRQKQVTTAEVFSKTPLNLWCQRDPMGNKRVLAWNQLF